MTNPKLRRGDMKVEDTAVGGDATLNNREGGSQGVARSNIAGDLVMNNGDAALSVMGVGSARGIVAVVAIVVVALGFVAYWMSG